MLKAKSVREAVEKIHVPTRLWLGYQKTLAQLARDPSSWMFGIRDVALYMIPAYIPDPRRRIEDVIAADKAAADEFAERYLTPRAGALARLVADFPRLPAARVSNFGPSHNYKIHSGLVTIVGAEASVTYRDRVPVMFYNVPLASSGHNVFYDPKNHRYMIGAIPYDGTHFGSYALPCGLLIRSEMSIKSLVITNLATRESCIVPDNDTDCVFGDYGDSYRLGYYELQMIGAGREMACIRY